MESILRIEQIEKYYGNKLNLTKAIDNISFDVDEGGICCHNGSFRKWKNNFTKLYFYNW